MPAPLLYYIRHGETDWNREGRLQGQHDIPINATGRSQARHCGGVLRELIERDRIDPAGLDFVASPLGRARETMELVHRAHSRDSYARGALLAAKFLADRPPGRYTMNDVLGL